MAAAEAIYQQLTILLALATASHFFIKRFHQPTIIGEIALGVVLGPSILGSLNIFEFDETLVAVFAALGSIFLLFLIGLESDFRAIYTRRNIAVATGGIFFPLGAGFVTAFFLVESVSIGVPNPNQFAMALFVGATLTATSTAIAASVLLDLGLMKERVAQTILGAAVIDDILGLMVLSIVVGTAEGRVNPLDIAILMGTAFGFIVVGLLVGIHFFRKVVVRIQVEGMRLGLKHGGFIIAMAITFFFALTAESIGLSAIIGAFLAGALFANSPLQEDFTEGARYLGSVFTPIFFVSMGLQVNLPQVLEHPQLFPFAIALIAVAIVTKVAGCAIAARLSKMTRHEAIAVGWGMTPRGEVGLIVALAALTAGVIGNALFSVIVLVMIVVSIVPAPFFKRALEATAAEKRGQPEAAAGSNKAPPEGA
jgi:Kef-type K+ transport system membrane component KefB